MTDGTDFFWYFAAAFTGRAGCCLLDLAKDRINDAHLLATTTTRRTGLHFVAWLDRRAMTVAALVVHVQFDYSFVTEHCLFERQCDGRFDVTTALRLLWSAAAKKLVENITEATAIAEIKVNIL